MVSESHDELHSRFALSGDKPIESSAEDRLDRVRFAEALATQIATAPVTGSFVIGLTGPWGSGKTSLLNMVSETLTENQPDIVVLKFNPWLFSGTEQLVARFFEEMGTQLLEKPDEKLKRVGSALEAYGQLLSPLKFVPVAGQSLDMAAAAMKATGSFLQSRADEGPISVDTQRRNLESALRDLGKRVVVVIDDIDRLHPAEIRDVVRLVRLTADFPGTVYMLAFDRPRVEQALSEVENDGSVYLEKILQVAYDVPPIQEAKLTELLISGLNLITESVSHGPYDEPSLQDAFYLTIRPLFKTVRDVRRYLNALPLAFAVVGDEVSLTDVLALEAMRTAAPAAFSKLSSASEALTGAPQAYLGFQRNQQSVDERKAELEDLIESAGKHSNVIREMCTSIFPASQSYLRNTHYGPEWLKTWRTDRRVAHPEVLRFYLEKGLPEGVMSAKNVDAIFDALGDHDRLASLLSGMDSETLEHTLERLEDYEDDYPVEDVEVAVRILMSQTERLREGRQAMFDPGADMKLQRVVLRLLGRVDDENERALMLKRMLPHLGSISAQMMLVQMAGHREHVGHSLVSEQDAARLEQHLCSAFQRASPESLVQERDLLRIMGWTEKIGGEPMRHRAREVVEDDNVFLRMLRSALSESHSQKLGSTAVSTELTMPWDFMVSLLDESLLLRRIKEIADSVEHKALDERTASALTVAERYASGWRPSS